MPPECLLSDLISGDPPAAKGRAGSGSSRQKNPAGIVRDDVDWQKLQVAKSGWEHWELASSILENGRAHAGYSGTHGDEKINCLLPVGDQELWVGTDHGLFRWNGTGISACWDWGLRSVTSQWLTILRDRDFEHLGGLLREGFLFRINASGTSFAEGRRHAESRCCQRPV